MADLYNGDGVGTAGFCISLLRQQRTMLFILPEWGTWVVNKPVEVVVALHKLHMGCRGAHRALI